MSVISLISVRRLTRVVSLCVVASAIAAGALVGAGESSAATGGIGQGAEPSTGSGGGAKTGNKFRRRWERAAPADRRWARVTAECESGRDPNAIGGANGEYRGAFMFLLQSWEDAPLSPGGDPIDYSYVTQAVVALALKDQLGTKPWPVCG